LQTLAHPPIDKTSTHAHCWHELAWHVPDAWSQVSPGAQSESLLHMVPETHSPVVGSQVSPVRQSVSEVQPPATHVNDVVSQVSPFAQSESDAHVPVDAAAQ
jgi:hypothetical protein